MLRDDLESKKHKNDSTYDHLRCRLERLGLFSEKYSDMTIFSGRVPAESSYSVECELRAGYSLH